jgi:hypothetical protein
MSTSPEQKERFAGPNEAQVIRQMICHENDLINHRMTWFLTFHGLLFAALGFAWEKRDAAPLIYILCGLGIVVSLSSITVFSAADRAIHELRDFWDTTRLADYKGPDVVGYRHKTDWPKPFLVWRFLPWVLTAAWLAVAIVNRLR